MELQYIYFTNAQLIFTYLTFAQPMYFPNASLTFPKLHFNFKSSNLSQLMNRFCSCFPRNSSENLWRRLSLFGGSGAPEFLWCLLSLFGGFGAPEDLWRLLVSPAIKHNFPR